jgi:hypothetical protein
MRPLIMDAFEERDAARLFPFRIELPQAGAYRVDLDAFIKRDQGWVWAARYGIPSEVLIHAPWVSVDPPERDRIIPCTQPSLKNWQQHKVSTVDSGLRPLGPGASIETPNDWRIPKDAALIELRVRAHGDPQLLIEWGRMGEAIPTANQAILPLMADGELHRYQIDLRAFAAWNLSQRNERVRVTFGRDGRGVELHELLLGSSRPLVGIARGTYFDENGRPTPILFVDGSSGDETGRVWVERGRDVLIEVRAPADSGVGVPFAVFLKRGMPELKDSHSLESFGIDARVPILPAELGGDASVSILASSLQGFESTAVQCAPAPCQFHVRIPAYPGGTELFLLPVFANPKSGVGRALILKLQ